MDRISETGLEPSVVRTISPMALMLKPTKSGSLAAWASTNISRIQGAMTLNRARRPSTIRPPTSCCPNATSTSLPTLSRIDRSGRSMRSARPG